MRSRPAALFAEGSPGFVCDKTYVISSGPVITTPGLDHSQVVTFSHTIILLQPYLTYTSYLPYPSCIYG
jgi:hypothetical protein